MLGRQNAELPKRIGDAAAMTLAVVALKAQQPLLPLRATITLRFTSLDRLRLRSWLRCRRSQECFGEEALRPVGQDQLVDARAQSGPRFRQRDDIGSCLWF